MKMSLIHDEEKDYQKSKFEYNTKALCVKVSLKFKIHSRENVFKIEGALAFVSLPKSKHSLIRLHP